MKMYKLLRPLLFRISPEVIHDLIVVLMKIVRYIPGMKWILRKSYGYQSPTLEREVFGLKFTNPVGLAAGFDKNGEIVDELATLGFGFIEIGSVTPLSQPGNPRPRVFRLEEDSAIINRMGINNEGVKDVVKFLRKHKDRRIIVGGNISKNTSTPNAEAPEDYERAFMMLYDYVDYFVINVSCPNVKNLCKLQDVDSLNEIVRRVTEQRKYHDIYKPILLKLSPDLANEQIDEAVMIVRNNGLDGIVATNTTIGREGLKTTAKAVESIGKGGLSGHPLTQRSLEMVRYIHGKTEGQVPIIGVGGIMSEQDALNMLEAGATLIQVYTGFIYNGPAFAKKILKKIDARSRK